tara:strand:+ start:278 stop:2482 length:2205 start_codon:yes stop_codon:yes gene_type:complete
MAGEANIWNPRTMLQLSADTKRIEEKITAVAGQTLFTLTTFAYTADTGSLAIYLLTAADVALGVKGARLLKSAVDWTEGTTTTFSIVTSLAAGDQVYAVGYVGITANVDVRDTDIYVSNYQAIRDYAGTEVTLYSQGKTTAADDGEAFFQKITGAAPGFYVDDDLRTIVPTGGDGSIGWVRNELKVKLAAAAKLEKTLTARFESADVVDFAQEYLTAAEIAQIDLDYPTGTLNTKPTIDITAKLIQAITDLGGSHDITTAFLYEPAKVLMLPAGVMGLELVGLARVLVGVNNIIISGAGMFNTRLVHIGTAAAQEMIRFKEAYACGLTHMTLDGGLPWSPAGTETFGCDVPLVLDQCAHFYAEGLNVCNYRLRGIQCIHLWESFLGNDLRCFNGGWFALGADDPGGLVFDAYLQESTFFSGSESNQVYIGKYAFSGIGSVVRFTSPCFNMHIDQIVAEGRTVGSYIPPRYAADKIYVSGVSAGIVIDHAWYYFHDQVLAIGAGAVLFNFFNAGPGCYFNNQVMFQEIPVAAPTNVLECPKIILNSSAHPVHLDINIEDRNATTTFWSVASAGSLIEGDIVYRKDVARTVADLISTQGPTNYVGKITMSTGAFTTTPPVVYTYKGRSETLSAIQATGSFPEYACRAVATFDGGAAGGAIMEQGITMSRTAAGQYTGVFDVAFPDNKSAVILSLVKSNLGDDAEVASVTTTGFTATVRDHVGTVHDTTRLMVAVYR